MFGNDAPAFMDRASIYEHETTAHGDRRLWRSHSPRPATCVRLPRSCMPVLPGRATLQQRWSIMIVQSSLSPTMGGFLGLAAVRTLIGARNWIRGLLIATRRFALTRRRRHARSSRLVHLRRGEFQAALDDYDAVVRADAAYADSLYGRGLARLRLGQSEAGRIDIEAATARDENVASRYAGYGLTP